MRTPTRRAPSPCRKRLSVDRLCGTRSGDSRLADAGPGVPRLPDRRAWRRTHLGGPHDRTRHDRPPHLPQTIALAFGAIYLLVGIVGFFITGFDNFFGHTDETLIVFDINPAHNVVHILIGVAGLLLARTLEGARTYGWLLAAGYGAAFLYGIFAVGQDWDFLNLNWADNILHLVTAAAGVAIAKMPARSASEGRSTPPAAAAGSPGARVRRPSVGGGPGLAAPPKTPLRRGSRPALRCGHGLRPLSQSRGRHRPDVGLHARACLPCRAGVRGVPRVPRPRRPQHATGRRGAEGRGPQAGPVEPVPPRAGRALQPRVRLHRRDHRLVPVIAPEAINCGAPDTGNMETLMLFGTPEQKERWLNPLLEGEIRSAFAMTEPDVASSDARNIQTSIVRDGDDYVINGRKWWITGSADERCQIFIVMGKTDPDGPAPAAVDGPRAAGHPGVRDRPTPAGVRLPGPARPPELRFTDVRVPASNLLASEGDGFMIAQARLGPGRIHHCMRAIGMAERALALMVERADRGWRSAGRWPSRAPSRSRSRSPGSRSTRPGSTCSRPPT